MANFTAGTSFTDGVTNDVTAAKLNALIADAVPTSNLSLNSTTGTIATLNSTTGTIATLNSTTGTIVTGTFGTTTSTAATITTGTIPTLVATTLVTTGTGTAAAPAIVPTGDTNTGLFFPAADTIAFAEGGTESMRIDSSGNLGVGTTSPGYRLSSKQSGNTSLSSLGVASINSANDTFIGIGYDSASDTNRVYSSYISTGSFKPISFWTADAERLRIDSSGNVLVGTTSNFSADKMCLNFTSAQNGLGVRDDSNSSGANYAVFRNSTNGIVGTISRVTTTNAVAYNTSSDQRLKSNIADALPVLDKLMDVKVRQFDWTEGNLHQDAGFIAQELAPVLSGIVTEGKTQDDWWQLDYARLTPYLVKAIQEQQVIINELKTKVAALEAE